MPRQRFNNKSDANHKSIVSTLEKMGVQCFVMKQGEDIPDLLTGFNAWVLVEIKSGVTKPVKRGQIEFMSTAKGFVGLVVCWEEAYALASNPGVHALTNRQKQYLAQWLIRNPNQQTLSVNQFREVIKG